MDDTHLSTLQLDDGASDSSSETGLLDRDDELLHPAIRLWIGGFNLLEFEAWEGARVARPKVPTEGIGRVYI